MKFVKLILYRNHYRKDNYNDKKFPILASFFTDGGTNMNSVKEELLNVHSKGLTRNYTDMTIQGNEVIISPLFAPEEDVDQYSIKVNRNNLLKLIDQWEDLVNRNVPEIIFVQQDNTIFLTDTMPQELREKM